MRFLIGAVFGLILLPAFVFVCIRFGYAPVATGAAPLPFEKTMTGMALSARLAKEAPKQSPITATEANLLAGAKTYRDYCSECHGMSSGPSSAAAKGMFPPPPQFFHGDDLSGDPVGETYWKASNGIRLTGMPAFRGTLTDDQLWQVSQLIANGNKLPAAVQGVMAGTLATK
jgi:mono/diheme cytochrome c family protein